MKNKLINCFIAFVWFANGLFCKVLNLVPRHEQIVASILGEDYSRSLTVLIGLAEMVMAIWILSRFKRRFNVGVQIVVIATMNVLELLLVPDLLLWGKANIVFSFCFMLLIFYNEMYKNDK